MSQTLHPAIEQFLEHLQAERNYSAHTLRNYRSDLEAFFRALNLSRPEAGKPSRKAPAEISVHYLKIREYLGQLYARRRKPATIARKLAALRSFYRCTPSGKVWCRRTPPSCWRARACLRRFPMS